MEDFGADVRCELEKRNISQRELARDLNISAPYLSDILNSHRNAPLQKRKILAYLKKTRNLRAKEEV